jgi:hypothetical protein
MQESRAKNVKSIWILLTGMIIILGYFLPIFAERKILPTLDQIGNYGISETEETYTGYQGLAITQYQPFFLWFIAILLLSAIAMMVLSSIQMTGERTYPILILILIGLMTGSSFFILILFSWIGWILEAIILLNLMQIFYFDRYLKNSYREKIARVVILIVLIFLIPASMLLSWYFYPIN